MLCRFSPAATGRPPSRSDPHMARDIVRDGRLLEPEHLVRGERARRPDRLVRAPAHVGVDHQRDVRTEQLAHRGDPCCVLRQALAADLHLDCPEALHEVVLGLAQQLVEREAKIDAAGVSRHLRVVAAEQAPERQAPAPGHQVPERGVERRDRMDRKPAAPDVVDRPPELLPERFDPGLVAAPRAAARGRARSAAGWPRRRRRPCKCSPGLGAIRVAQAHRDQLERRHRAVGRIRQRRGQRDPKMVRPHRCDRHARNLPCPVPAGSAIARSAAPAHGR